MENIHYHIYDMIVDWDMYHYYLVVHKIGSELVCYYYGSFVDWAVHFQENTCDEKNWYELKQNGPTSEFASENLKWKGKSRKRNWFPFLRLVIENRVLIVTPCKVNLQTFYILFMFVQKLICYWHFHYSGLWNICSI